jgi:hypothetical protein
MPGQCLRQVGLDLAAQTRNADIDHAIEGSSFVALEQIDQGIAAEHAVRMFKQDLEQGKFRTRHLNLLAVACQAARIEIDLERAEVAQAPFFRDRLPAAQHRRHPCQQLAVAERLGQIVIGPDFEADDAVDFFATRRQHDDGRCALSAEPTCQRQAVLARQHDIEQQQIHRVDRKVAFHRRTVAHPGCVIAVV